MRAGTVTATIKELRKASGMTQRDLAKALKITAAYLNDIEHDRRNIPDARILACGVAGIKNALIGARCAELESRISFLKSQMK